MAKRSSNRPPLTSQVECEYGGKIYRGTYYTSGGLLTVDCEFGSKSASPGAGPNVLAKIMLRELIQEADRKGMLRDA